MQVVRKSNNESFISKKDNSEYIQYNFDYNTLSLFMSYIFCDSELIKISDLNRMRKLINSMDKSVFEADKTRIKLIELIEKALEARIDKRLNNKAAIVTYVKGGIMEDSKELEEFANLNKDEIDYVNENVSNALNCSVIQNEMEELKRIAIQYDMGDFRTKADMVDSIEEYIGRVHNNLRSNRNNDKDGSSLSIDNNVETGLYTVYRTLTKPNRFLKTQLQGFDKMVGGGLESSRFYLLLGNAGVGKSFTMLNLAQQIKNKNKYFKTKDPTKKPVILFLTQENSLEETVDRLFSIVSGQKTMRKYSYEEVLDILLNKGQLSIDEESNIGLEIVYRPDRSITTADLEDMIVQYDLEGKEVICIFQDHIKRIKSIENIKETRLELGAVVNELKNIAIRYDIPVISVSHLNRDAARIIDQGATSNKADLTRLLGRSNVSESFLMIDNSDCVIILGKEVDGETEYMAFNIIKLRYAKVVLKYMLYELDGLKIITDDHLPVPAYIESLRPENKANVGVSAYSQNNASIFSDNKNFKIMDDLAKEEEFEDNTNTIFEQSSIKPIKITPSIMAFMEDPEKLPIDLVKWAS